MDIDSAPSSSLGPASFATQADALLRKNLTFQVTLLSYVSVLFFFLCLLGFIIKSFLQNFNNRSATRRPMPASSHTHLCFASSSSSSRPSSTTSLTSPRIDVAAPASPVTAAAVDVRRCVGYSTLILIRWGHAQFPARRNGLPWCRSLALSIGLWVQIWRGMEACLMSPARALGHALQLFSSLVGTDPWHKVCWSLTIENILLQICSLHNIYPVSYWLHFLQLLVLVTMDFLVCSHILLVNGWTFT